MEVTSSGERDGCSLRPWPLPAPSPRRKSRPEESWPTGVVSQLPGSQAASRHFLQKGSQVRVCTHVWCMGKGGGSAGQLGKPTATRLCCEPQPQGETGVTHKALKACSSLQRSHWQVGRLGGGGGATLRAMASTQEAGAGGWMPTRHLLVTAALRVTWGTPWKARRPVPRLPPQGPALTGRGGVHTQQPRSTPFWGCVCRSGAGPGNNFHLFAKCPVTSHISPHYQGWFLAWVCSEEKAGVSASHPTLRAGCRESSSPGTEAWGRHPGPTVSRLVSDDLINWPPDLPEKPFQG